MESFLPNRSGSVPSFPRTSSLKKEPLLPHLSFSLKRPLPPLSQRWLGFKVESRASKKTPS